MSAKATSSRLLGTFSAPREPGQRLLVGKTGIILGVANDQSITWGCAEVFRGIGADLCITYLGRDSRTLTEPLVQTLDVLPAAHLPCGAYLRACTRQ